MDDINLEADGTSFPGVFSISQRAHFYKDENGRDMVEISFVGQKDTVVHYVSPQHMAQYKREWDAYCDKQPLELRRGTPLSELFDEKSESKYVAVNIHNLEELAALNDLQCQGVGRGTMTDRENAQRKLAQNQYEEEVARRRKIDELVAPLSTAAAAPNLELETLKQTISELEQGMKTLQEGMLLLVRSQAPLEEQQPRKRMGWPKGKKRKPKTEVIESDPESEA